MTELNVLGQRAAMAFLGLNSPFYNTVDIFFGPVFKQRASARHLVPLIDLPRLLIKVKVGGPYSEVRRPNMTD